jgi:hypothetical protein
VEEGGVCGDVLDGLTPEGVSYRDKEDTRRRSERVKK